MVQAAVLKIPARVLPMLARPEIRLLTTSVPVLATPETPLPRFEMPEMRLP